GSPTSSNPSCRPSGREKVSAVAIGRRMVPVQGVRPTRQDGVVEPIVTPAEMAEIDAAAPEPVEELVERAGAAVARSAIDLLGGTYGRRVVVVAGKGNNGADGRAAARRLER